MKRTWNYRVHSYKISFEELGWILDWIENGGIDVQNTILMLGMNIEFNIDKDAIYECHTNIISMKITYNDILMKDNTYKEMIEQFFLTIDKFLEY